MSSTGSTNTLQPAELGKLKSMKEMIQLKSDQIKLYKDSFGKVKSKSPSKYQQSYELQNSQSQPNLNNSSQIHKRSSSHNMTSNSNKTSHGTDVQKNLI